VLGNAVSAKDGKGNVSQISYTDNFGVGANPAFGSAGSFGPTYALPTQITSPPPNAGEQAHTARSQYDFSTGLLTGFADRNGIITQSLYNDPFNRPTLVKSALGTAIENHTAMYYAPATALGMTLANNDVLTAKDLNSTGDGLLRSWSRTDGFGRARESWTADAVGDVVVETGYDGLGRAVRTSNPHRVGEAPLYTTTTFDLAGRVLTVTTPDNAVVTTSYSGSSTTVRDQAGKQRRSRVDGLGRLVQVDEMMEHPSTTVYASTTYSYNALDNLTQVTQGTQPQRQFTYDWVGRLTNASNPESGNTSYQYDNNSNLLSKTDARSITTNYTYDALNRVKQRSYTGDPQNTPTVNYGYDAATVELSKGRLTSVSSSVSSYSYGEYDELGRVKQSTQTTSGN
jgi:YD repeat-containing protein